MNRILVTGATGAMGAPLIRILSEIPNTEVYATSRSQRQSEKIHWLIGDAMNDVFFKESLEKNRFDAIVDFMNYKTAKFSERYDFILQHTSHYLFTSSARVYAQSDHVIKEESPRILDVCKDAEYLSKDSYALEKARQEDILFRSGYKNWTVFRPSLTYNDRRLQFTIFELSEWIYRVLDGNSIIFPSEMRDIVTTMTHGRDVAAIISRLILNSNAYGEAFNINGGGHLTWGEVLDVYQGAIEKSMGRKAKICEVNGIEQITKHLNRYDQYRLARGISRVFTNEKVEAAIGGFEYIPMNMGLAQCLQTYLQTPDAISLPFRTAAYYDSLAGEITPLRRVGSVKHKIGYCLGRAGLIQV